MSQSGRKKSYGPLTRDRVPTDAPTSTVQGNRGTGQFADNRASASVQRRIAETLQHGPSQLRQQELTETLARSRARFGVPAEHRPLQNSRSVSNTVQRKWVPSETEGILMWDSPMNGNTWLYNTATDRQSYRNLRGEVSEERTYLDWLQRGFQGLKDSVLKADALRDAPGIDPRPETPEESFLKVRNEGAALYADATPGGTGEISPAWREHYERFTDVDDPTFDSDGNTWVHVHSGFKMSYGDRIRLPGALGRYDNKFNLTTGMITAIDNHRDPSEPLNNNEVIFHQLAMACEKAREPLRIAGLVRKNVINSVLEPILRRIGRKEIDCTPDNEYSDLFYVLLTTPNVKVALFIIKDRGRLLGLSRVSMIKVQGKDVTIIFA